MAWLTQLLFNFMRIIALEVLLTNEAKVLLLPLKLNWVMYQTWPEYTSEYIWPEYTSAYIWPEYTSEYIWPEYRSAYIWPKILEHRYYQKYIFICMCACSFNLDQMFFTDAFASELLEIRIFFHHYHIHKFRMFKYLIT